MSRLLGPILDASSAGLGRCAERKAASFKTPTPTYFIGTSRREVGEAIYRGQVR
jgi:hypothetical protein